MEHVESPSSQIAAASNDEKPSVTVAASSVHDDEENAKPNLAPSTTSTVNGKRQRTLFDMLGSKPGQGSETSQASNKKPKLTAPASGKRPTTAAGAQSSAGGSSSAAGGLQALNSIPFSSTEYTASLNEDQKRLLKLECETIGKSW